EPGERAPQEANRGHRVLAAEHLDVGEPRVVVDAHVHELPAGHPAQDAIDALGALQAPGPCHAVACGEDAAELLDVDVDELAGAAALVAVRWLRRLKPRA